MTRSAIHCCREMERALGDDEIPVIYNAKFREIGIRIIDGGSAYIVIQYCPWCGVRLPPSLRDAWFERLEVLSLDPEDAEVPSRNATTDAWWKDKSS